MVKKGPKAICIFGANWMLQQVKALECELSGALLADDIEHVHQLRVASRRLRNGFTHFNDCLPAKKASDWQDAIKRITRALGTARDLDIQIELLHRLNNETLDAALKPGYKRLLLRLTQRRITSQGKINKTVDQLRQSKALDEMRIRFTSIIEPSEGMYLYTPSLYQKAYSAINATLEDFLSYQKYIRYPEAIQELHAMRISGKHLRYTLEIFAPIYHQALLPYIRIMKEIQDLLGSIHDDDVWVSWLPTFIEEETSRIQDYFGNTGPLRRLLPGFHRLIENRQQARELTYQTFLATWDNLESEKAWDALHQIIQAPMNIEAALAVLSLEEEVTDIEAETDGVEPSIETPPSAPNRYPTSHPNSENLPHDQSPLNP